VRILYLGDIVGKPGRAVVGKLLPRLRIDHDIDIVIAQSENITHGKGLSLNHFNELRRFGVDIFTGGNHSFERKDNCKLVSDDSKPVTAPGNLINNKMPLYKIVTVDSAERGSAREPVVGEISTPALRNCSRRLAACSMRLIGFPQAARAERKNKASRPAP
jgi:calcineurin-like phosphoesterase